MKRFCAFIAAMAAAGSAVALPQGEYQLSMTEPTFFGERSGFYYDLAPLAGDRAFVIYNIGNDESDVPNGRVRLITLSDNVPTVSSFEPLNPDVLVNLTRIDGFHGEASAVALYNLFDGDTMRAALFEIESGEPSRVFSVDTQIPGNLGADVLTLSGDIAVAGSPGQRIAGVDAPGVSLVVIKRDGQSLEVGDVAGSSNREVSDRIALARLDEDSFALFYIAYDLTALKDKIYGRVCHVNEDDLTIDVREEYELRDFESGGGYVLGAAALSSSRVAIVGDSGVFPVSINGETITDAGQITYIPIGNFSGGDPVALSSTTFAYGYDGGVVSALWGAETFGSYNALRVGGNNYYAATNIAGNLLIAYDVPSSETEPSRGAVRLALSSTNQGLSAISTRGNVGMGDDILIGGFIVRGAEPRQILMRGLGPNLSESGIQTPILSDPYIRLYRVGETTTLVGENDDWLQNSNAQEIAQIQATYFTGLLLDEKEAALLITLPPGSYTPQLSGVGSSTGVGLVEIYDIDALREGAAKGALESAK